MSAWQPNGVAFFWVPKEAFDLIEKNLERGAAASAKLVYVALCLIANREGEATFSKPINYLAVLASLERRTVERRLPDLERLGLIQVQRAKLRASHTYTIVTLSRNDTSLSRSVATAPSLQPVALPREQENKRRKPLPAPERISTEKRLTELRRTLQRLKEDTSEQWQREAYPERLAELRSVEVQIADLEGVLL
jgi:hypothetical protein